MAADLFSKSQKQEIINAISNAELNTSGEIRVHIERTCKEEPLDRASGVFDMLGMQKTKLRNGVLFYLAVKDRKFAILGDAGINEKVSDDFWDHIKDEILNNFKEEKFTEGLVTGIEMAGKALKEHFPYQSDDKNELSDEISFGNE